MIFLDTHVVMWLYEGMLDKIPAVVQKKFVGEDEVHISPMVELEIDFLREIGRFKPKGSTVTRYLEAHFNLHISRVDFYRITEEAQQLTWTRDLFDRLIVANASIFQASLLTKDQNILKYYKLASWD